MADNSYIIKEAQALYPRIDKTYRFDTKANKSVPCDALDDGSAYELSFAITEKAAKELYKSMKAYYDEKKESGWPDKFPLPFKKRDDGNFEGKTKLKGAYGKEPTRPPLQFDSANTKLPSDFKLTTGSVVNVAVSFVPYSTSTGAGVSLRINAVQVLKYQPMASTSPFSATDGYVAEEGNPFAEVADEVAVEAEESEPVVEEPKKVVKKSAPAPKADDDLSAIIDDWDD